eukprot:407789-Hanusia_phi.AAC.1
MFEHDNQQGTRKVRAQANSPQNRARGNQAISSSCERDRTRATETDPRRYIRNAFKHPHIRISPASPGHARHTRVWSGIMEPGLFQTVSRHRSTTSDLTQLAVPTGNAASAQLYKVVDADSLSETK